jgi:hypothetical protein
VADDGGADSIFRFRLKRGGDETKCHRKMKRWQRARVDSMGRKYDTTRRHGVISWRRGL